MSTRGKPTPSKYISCLAFSLSSSALTVTYFTLSLSFLDKAIVLFVFIGIIKSFLSSSFTYKKDKLNGKYVTVSALELRENAKQEIYLEGVGFPLVLIKQIFKNEDGSEGILYLVSSELTITYDTIKTIYQKRWKVEEYHKSLKQHVCLCKSPTKKVRTQSNHIFASIYAFFKLELLGIKSKVNATALRTKLYITANRAAFSELENMKACFDMKF